jgi:hypothetical protein
MRSILLLGLVAMGIGVTAGTLWADLAPWPFKSPSTSPERYMQGVTQMAAVPPPNLSHIVIQVKKDATRPTLILPRPMLDRVQARREKAQATISKPQVAPLFLALAMAAGGLCLLRGRTRLAFAAGMLLVAGLALGLNRSRLEASPPPAMISAQVPRVKLGELLLDDLDIVVKPKHDQITLTLPASLLPRLRR